MCVCVCVCVCVQVIVEKKVIKDNGTYLFYHFMFFLLLLC